MTTVFWKIRFPFHAKLIETNAKFFHITVLLLGLGIPLIPIVAGFSTGGFVVDHFPPLICVTRSADAAYYTLALPVSVIIAIGTSLLALVLITIAKVRLMELYSTFITTLYCSIQNDVKLIEVP